MKKLFDWIIIIPNYPPVTLLAILFTLATIAETGPVESTFIDDETFEKHVDELLDRFYPAWLEYLVAAIFYGFLAIIIMHA